MTCVMCACACDSILALATILSIASNLARGQKVRDRLNKSEYKLSLNVLQCFSFSTRWKIDNRYIIRMMVEEQ